MNKMLWGLTFVTVMGCQSGQVREERLRVVEQSSDAVLCYSLIDESFNLNEQGVLKELEKREIDSCLNVIADHECPVKMESRQDCLEQTKVRVSSKLQGMQPGVGTELLIKGIQVGIGVLPF